MAPASRVAAAVLAGGMGTRLGSAVPKPFMTLFGHPLIHYSLRLFESIPEVVTIRVAIPAGQGPTLDRQLSPYPRRAYRGWVPGGDTRPESALAVLRALEADEPEVVLIHDAARPLVQAEDVRNLLGALPGLAGVFLAAPPVDTLWSVDEANALEVVDRRGLVRAFTPQAFPYAVIREAYEKGMEEGFKGTDDASYVRHAGGEVAWVPGSRLNLKVTYPEDLALVEAILGGEGCA
jgi:2-C-methyl-D-erythritol 4-phosphate cytidylyltransferase